MLDLSYNELPFVDFEVLSTHKGLAWLSLDGNSFADPALVPDAEWKESWLKFAFWSMNIGLFAMTVGSLLPVGLAQTWASVEYGYWYARSTEFLGTPLMQTLRWMRLPGDTLFGAGAVALVAFVFSIRPKRTAA